MYVNIFIIILLKTATVQIRNSCSHEDGLSSKNHTMSDSATSQLTSKDKDIYPTEFVIQIEQIRFDCIVDCPSDLAELETVWVRVNYHTVCHVKVSISLIEFI